MENEILENNIEKTECPEAETCEAIEDVTPRKSEDNAADEWTAITKRKRADESESDENRVPEPEIMPEAIEEPTIEVISENEIRPTVEVNEEIEGRSAELMAAEAKRERKAARKEARQNTKDYEDDGSLFKSRSFREIWDKISLVLLVLAIGLPVGLLAYIIVNFFL